MSGWRLVADVGGTNVRFARVSMDGALADIASTPSREYVDFTEALASYLDSVGGARLCEFAAIGAAGPVEHGVAQLTNGPWLLDAGAISAELGGTPVRLINDLEAVGHAVARLQLDDLATVICPVGAQRGPRLVVNVGTGFGAAIAAPSTDGWVVIGCEPGHMRLALDDGLAMKIKKRSPSIEDVLSGLGLQSAWVRNDPLASDDFARLFGQACGDLVLATGCWGGLYLCGSVAGAWAAAGRFDAFSLAFESKGPMAARMRNVAVVHIVNPHAALIGLAALPKF